MLDETRWRWNEININIILFDTFNLLVIDKFQCNR